MPDITITFQQEGDELLAFRIPSVVATKLDEYIAARNNSAVLGLSYKGKADWFLQECHRLILKPVLDSIPDAPPTAAQEKLAQAAVLQREAARIIAEAAVEPLIPIPAAAIRERR